MKWRALPPQPEPELVLTEQVGRFAVEVRRVRQHDGTLSYHATATSELGTRYLDISLDSAEDALCRAARTLGFEPDDEG